MSIEKKMDIQIVQDISKKKKQKLDFKIAIVVNLFYENELDYYVKCLACIPKEIDLYLFSSNEVLLQKLRETETFHRNTFIYKKNNRGRDISALLVAFKPYMQQYTYFCFLHDKKEKYELLEKDVIFWRENLWKNMIFSEEYIWNVIALMQEKNYGILVPPKTIGTYLDTMYADSWRKNFDNVVQLADRLGIQIPICKEDEKVLTIGSVFWCKTEAMKKLFAYDWTYQDFLEEPLPADGTISHAIERIFGFVALDAGYKAGVIMNCEYATKLSKMMQEKLTVTYQWMKKEIGVRNTFQLEQLEKEKKIIWEMQRRNKKIYLYGAGFYGDMFLKRMKFWKMTPAGFVVSDGRKTQEYYRDYKIYELKELKTMDNIAVVIAVGYTQQQEIADCLEKYGIADYYKAVVTE